MVIVAFVYCALSRPSSVIGVDKGYSPLASCERMSSTKCDRFEYKIVSVTVLSTIEKCRNFA